MLYLNADSHLQDCKDVDDCSLSDDDMVVDYKKHSRRRVSNYGFDLKVTSLCCGIS